MWSLCKIVATTALLGIIRLRALEAGAYNFFDDFHQETQGTLDVK